MALLRTQFTTTRHLSQLSTYPLVAFLSFKIILGVSVSRPRTILVDGVLTATPTGVYISRTSAQSNINPVG